MVRTPEENVQEQVESAREEIGTETTNTNDEDQNNDEQNEEVTRPRKKRRDSSDVWSHFTRMPIRETGGKPRAKCNYCPKNYASHPSNDGTASLWRHYSKCKGNPNRDTEGQSLLAASFNKSLTHHLFSQDRGRKAVAKYLIKDEMPFRTVEKEGFSDLLQEFQPKFQMPSRWTAARDCYNIYLEEAEILKTYFKRSKVRVSLTTDCWTSLQNSNYMCLTAHWIDDDWVLQKRILNFCEIEDHKGKTIAKTLEDCLFQWGIAKVFTITVDNASANDSAIAILRKRKLNLVCDGEFLQMRCAAHILNLIVSEGLKDINKSIELIRRAVKFVKSSPSRKRKFIMLAEKERVESKSLLCLDCPTRWNSTYLMLESAVKFSKVFTRMGEEDEDYRDYFKKRVRIDSSRDDYALLDLEYNDDHAYEYTIFPPGAYDWGVATEFLGFLQLFYTMTLKFSGSNYVTTNTCFQHIVAIETNLRSSASNSHSLLNEMANRMLTKFDKYWGKAEKMNPLLIVATILDPRYKLTYVKVAFEKLFPDSTMLDAMLKKTTSVLHRLYDHYSGIVQPDGSSTSQSTIDQEGGGIPGDNVQEAALEMTFKDPTMEEFLVKADQQCNVEKISELDEYLQSELSGFRDPKFDVLSWWKGNASKYPILSLLARDLLAAPVSTVSSESAFSTGGRILDAFRSSLSAKMAEALVCAQNWLSTKHPQINDLDVDNFDETASIVSELDTAASKAIASASASNATSET